MIYTCCTPPALEQRMFAEAKAMGSSFIRLDVEMAPIFEAGGAWRPQPDWNGLDRVEALSRQYGLPVVGVLRATPTPLSTCPEGPDPGECPPSDYGRYGSLAGQIASHARGTIRYWEVLNEPDGSWAFTGSAADYAWMLRRTYDAVKSAAPEDRVLLGGVMGVSSRGWLGRVFDTPGADAQHRFDIANLHLRAPLIALQSSLTAFRAFLAGRGFHGPLWLTEHGYPGAPGFQSDPAYRGGEQAQARYLRQSLPTLVRAGAAQVFVTLRDGTPAEFGNSAYTSEGLLHVGSSTPYAVRLKPAFALVQWLARLWPRLPATARDLERWRTQLRVEEPLVRAYLRRGYRERKLARRYRGRARHAKKARSRHRYLRAAARHDRKYALYTQRIAGHVAAARLLSSLIAGYREGP
jgi:hypothetical protein